RRHRGDRGGGAVPDSTVRASVTCSPCATANSAILTKTSRHAVLSRRYPNRWGPELSGPTLFFTSRRRHTSWPRAWSSDVCSSDLSAETTRACRARYAGEHEESEEHLEHTR